MAKRRGPPAKPRELRVLNGNAARRPLPEKVGLQPGIPKAPKHLNRAGKYYWRKIAAILDQAKLITLADQDALMLLVQAREDYINARAQIEQHGSIIVAPSGYPIQSPYMAIANKAHDQMRGLLQEFGLTPASRVRAQPLGDPATKSAFQELAERVANAKRQN